MSIAAPDESVPETIGSCELGLVNFLLLKGGVNQKLAPGNKVVTLGKSGANYRLAPPLLLLFDFVLNFHKKIHVVVVATEVEGWVETEVKRAAVAWGGGDRVLPYTICST